VVDNYCEGGKGIWLEGCKTGIIANNSTKDTRYHIVNESVGIEESNNTATTTSKTEQ
jgi:hypothetical protein